MIDFTPKFSSHTKLPFPRTHLITISDRKRLGPARNHGLLDFSQRFTPASALFSSPRSTTAGVRGQNSSTANYEITESVKIHHFSLARSLFTSIQKILSHKNERERETRHLLRKCTTKHTFRTRQEKKATGQSEREFARAAQVPSVLSISLLCSPFATFLRFDSTDHRARDTFSLFSFLPRGYQRRIVQSDVLCRCEAAAL